MENAVKKPIVENAVEDSWAIRPCFLYNEEYKECTSFKARFHQYFIYGETIDCLPWKRDHENCLSYENDNDVKAGQAVVKSEQERRNSRMNAHFANDVWKKRVTPPSDWNKPLPEWLIKRNENTYLDLKAKELSGMVPVVAEERSYCSIM